MTITVSAPGKVHLLGEHAIVYGKPAILSAIDKRCTVTLTPSKSAKVKIFSKQLKQTKEVELGEILKLQQAAQEKWQEYRKNNDISLLKSLTQDELDFVVITIGETLNFLHKKLNLGFNLEIDCEIPLGAGLGSSASVAVSVIGVLFLLLSENLDKEKINEIAYLAEQKRHGNVSGGDNSTITYGGLIWYRKETPDLKIIQPLSFTLAKNMVDNFVLIDTGRPKESTGEMVGLVQKLFHKRPKWTEKILNDQEKQVKKLYEALKANNERLLMEVIKSGERNLERLGVVSELSHDLIREMEKLGAVGKICGGGGKADKSGMLLFYHKEPKLLLEVAKRHHLPSWQVKLGQEGIKVENG